MLTSNRSQLWGKNDYCFGRCYQSSYRHCGLCHRGRCHPCARGGRLCESGGTLAPGLGWAPPSVVTVAPCNPAVDDCISPTLVPLLVTQTAPQSLRTPAFWFGSPANPDFQPLIGIAFPNFFGLDFEACFLGAAVHLSPYPRHPEDSLASASVASFVRRHWSAGASSRASPVVRFAQSWCGPCPSTENSLSA